MPVYEYECETCSCRFELRQSFSDGPVASCPRCHNGARRVFVPVPIIFKGSGFYVTDHRNDDNGNGKKDGSKEAVKESLEKPKKESLEKTKEEVKAKKD